MNLFQNIFNELGIDLEQDNDMAELCDLLFDKFRFVQSENLDLKKYIIDTHEYGIDTETLKSRVAQYKKELNEFEENRHRFEIEKYQKKAQSKKMSFQGKYKINQELEIIEDEINEIMEKEGICGKFTVILSSLNEIRLTVNNLQKKG